jgi:hypothetical protein
MSFLLSQPGDVGKSPAHQALELFGGRREDGVAHVER